MAAWAIYLISLLATTVSYEYLMISLLSGSIIIILCSKINALSPQIKLVNKTSAICGI